MDVPPHSGAQVVTMDAGMPQFFMAVISAIFCGFLPIYVLIVWTSPFYNGNIAQ